MRELLNYLREAKLNTTWCKKSELHTIIGYYPIEIIKTAICIRIDDLNEILELLGDNINIFRVNTTLGGDRIIACNVEDILEADFVILFYTNNEAEIDAFLRYRLVLKKIGKSYKACGLCVKDDKNTLIVYSREKYLKRKTNEIVIYLSPIFTCGDSYILFIVIMSYIQRNNIHSVIFLHGGYDSYRIYSYLFKQFTHYDISNNNHISELDIYRCKYEVFVLGNYLCPEINLLDTGQHISTFFLKVFALEYNDLLKTIDNISGYLDAFCTSRTRELKKIKIGVQFYSTTDNGEMVGNMYPYRKSWPYKYAQDFVDICNSYGFEVYQLTRHNGKLYCNCNNYVDISFDDIYNKISDLDIFVGIDSVFGHLSALMGIKNITIFGNATAYWTYSDTREKYKLSFVPLRLNYSLSDLDGDIRRILPEKVFDIMLHILEGKVLLDGSIVTYDTVHNEYI